MRRVTVVALLVCLMVSVVVPLAYGEEDVVEINWIEWWDSEYGEDNMDELIAMFEEQNPGIKVTRTPVGWGSMYESIITSAQNEVAEYDVLGMEPCCWMSALVKLGALEPLQQYIDNTPGFRERLISDLAIQEWAGDAYSVLWYMMPYTYAYDMDAFEAAGVDAPTNWQEMVEVTKALNESDAVEYGLGAGFNHGFYTMYYHWGARLAQLGGKLYDEDSCAVFNSPEGAQAMLDWKELLDQDILVPGAIGQTEQDLQEFMKAGRLAAFFDGPWLSTVVKQDRPDARIAFAPAWTDTESGSGGYQWAGSGLSMSANSAHKEEAWKFIDFLMSDEATTWMSEQTSVSFATKANFERFGALDDPILKEMPAMLTQDPDNNIFFAPTVDFSVHDEWVTEFQDVLAGDRDPQEALDSLVELWNEELPQCQEE
jgi:multiple sugar transport system substrate-binding protein